MDLVVVVFFLLDLLVLQTVISLLYCIRNSSPFISVLSLDLDMYTFCSPLDLQLQTRRVMLRDSNAGATVVSVYPTPMSVTKIFALP